MKTYRNLYDKLCSYENLLLAFRKAKKGKTQKLYVIEFESKLEENLLKLQKELIEKIYQPEPIVTVIIRDPKTRKIGKAAFRDRVIHHALVNILHPIFDPTFICDNFASRKKKGHHKALERFDSFIRKITNNGKKLKGIKDNNYVGGYALKADIKKYFESVDHEILLRIIREKVKDENVLWLAQQILTYSSNSSVKGRGMPLGNYTSQFFANIYLNKFDYFVKHTLRIKYYLRYVDDFVILHKDKERLERYKRYIDEYLNTLGLRLHSTKSRIIPLHEGVPLLGFRVFYHYRLLKESSIRQLKRNLRIWRKDYIQGISYDIIAARLSGWLAHAEHGDTYKFRKRVAVTFNRLFFTPQNFSALGGGAKQTKNKVYTKIFVYAKKNKKVCPVYSDPLHPQLYKELTSNTQNSHPLISSGVFQHFFQLFLNLIS